MEDSRPQESLRQENVEEQQTREITDQQAEQQKEKQEQSLEEEELKIDLTSQQETNKAISLQMQMRLEVEKTIMLEVNFT